MLLANASELQRSHAVLRKRLSTALNGANRCDLVRAVLCSTACHGAAWCELVRRVFCKHTRVYCKPSLVMASAENGSAYSLSSGDNFPHVFASQSNEVTPYDKKRSTQRGMNSKQTQLQLHLSPVKTKAIQTWTCGRLLIEWGTHSGVSAENASRGIEDRINSVCCFDYVECVENAQRRRTAHRSTAVAVGLPLFASIFTQLRVLDGVNPKDYRLSMETAYPVK